METATITSEPVYHQDNQPAGPPSNWYESPGVIALAEYLETRQWVRLVEYDPNSYGLHFEDPGVSPADPEKWAQALHALSLLEEACQEIDHLRSIGRLPLSKMKTRWASKRATIHTWGEDGRKVLVKSHLANKE